MRSQDQISSGGNPLFTVGHSNRSIEEFIQILNDANIGVVTDARRLPGSRTYPQFNGDRLASSLTEVQIAYEHVPPLGGRRGTAGGVPFDANGAWRNKSFHDYSEGLRGGFDHLTELGMARRCAIICCEPVWWRCHRRLILDRPLARGRTRVLPEGQGRIEPGTPAPDAVFRDDGTVIYPATAV